MRRSLAHLTPRFSRMVGIPLAMAVPVALLVLGMAETGLLISALAMAGLAGALLAGLAPTPALCLQLLLLGLSPFFFGLDVGARGIFPFISAEEVLFALILPSVLLRAVTGRARTAAPSPGLLFAPLAAILLLAFGFLLNAATYVALRTFLETVVLGYLLYLVFLLETDSERAVLFTRVLALVGVLLAAGGLVEFAFKYNPLIEYAAKNLPDYKQLFISPRLLQRLNAFYRPYVIFFHPSEAGTFVAMCVPFVYLCAKDMRNRVAAAALLLLPLAFLVVNFTRGVWFAMAVVALAHPRLRRWAVPLCLVGLSLLAAASAMFEGHPFFDRVLAPRNLVMRFFYWGVAFRIFADNMPAGIGYMNFKNVYTEHMGAVPMDIRSEVQTIKVADNIFLTTAAEQGLVGLAGLLWLLGYLVWRVRTGMRRLVLGGRACDARFVQMALASMAIYVTAGLLADLHFFTKVTRLFFILAAMALALAEQGASAPGAGQDAPAPPAAPARLPQGGATP